MPYNYYILHFMFDVLIDTYYISCNTYLLWTFNATYFASGKFPFIVVRAIVIISLKSGL